MTVRKLNGVLTTRKRSGQVKPGNSMPSARRTSLRAPSAPMPAAGAGLGSPVALDRNLHPRAMLRDVLDLSVELQLETRLFEQLPVENTRELGLLALHPVGVGGDVGDGAEIELRQHAMPPAAILERQRGQSLRDQRPRGTEPIEHVERRRMEGRG